MFFLIKHFSVSNPANDLIFQRIAIKGTCLIADWETSECTERDCWESEVELTQVISYVASKTPGRCY